MNEKFHRLKQQVSQTYDAIGLSDSATRRRIIAKFAQKFGLIYFRTIDASSSHVSLIRGSTSSIDQKDSNMCIGMHDGYDMVFIERTSSIEVPGHLPSRHRWHIMQFDLHSHDSLPFLFVGTKQQSKAFYGKLFNIHREARHVDPAVHLQAPRHFQTNYTVVASPSEHLFVARVLSEEITATMAKHQQPFAIEIQGDSLYVITEATIATTMQSLTRMLHYGIWLARHIDSKTL